MTTAVGAPRPARGRQPRTIAVGVAARRLDRHDGVGGRHGNGGRAGDDGLGVPASSLMWTLMMAAMMLPAIAPLVVAVRPQRAAATSGRLGGFAAGYVLAWASTGVIAFGLASLFDALADDRPGVAHGVAVAAFAGCGVYQLTPMKRWCLRHCRSPLGHLHQYAAYRGPRRDLVPGFTTAWCASDAAGC